MSGGLQAEFGTQVDLADLLVNENDLRRPLGDNLPLVKDIGVITDAEGLPDIMVGNQYSNAFVRKLGYDLLDVNDSQRINAGKGFIQQDEQGVCGKHP